MAREGRRLAVKSPLRDVKGWLPIAAMAAILALCGWLVAGLTGMAAVLVAVLALVFFMPRIPPDLIMRFGGAQPLPVVMAPGLYQDLIAVSDRLGLASPPILYRLPSPGINAFSAGNGDGAAVALSDGLVGMLTERQVMAVMAHEMAHIAADDTGLMRLVALLGRLTHAIALAGLTLAVGMLFFVPQASVPLWMVWVLAAAPSLSTLLQLALMRRREYAADRVAALATRDPQALAEALHRMEEMGKGRLHWLLGHGPNPPPPPKPGRKLELPSWLRTHPATSRRILRLARLAGEIGQSETMQAEISRLAKPPSHR